MDSPTFQNKSLDSSEAADAFSDLRPSAAPRPGQHGTIMKKQASQSVKNILDTVGTPDMR